MTTTHIISVTRVMGDPDLGAEETVEITFNFRKGSLARLYGDYPIPADPVEVEYLSCKAEFPGVAGDWMADLAQKQRAEWAQDFIEGGDHDEEIMEVVNSDRHARREARREDRE